MKKILIINGILPTSKPFTLSSFIQKRIELLKKNGWKYQLISFDFIDSLSTFLFKQFFHKPSDYKRIPYESLHTDTYFWEFKTGFRSLIDLFFINRVFIKLIKAFNNQINFNKFDLIHAHFAYPAGVFAFFIKKKYKIPYCLTLHGSDIHTIPYFSKKYKRYTLLALENADKCIFVSNSLIKEAKNLGYSAHNALVSYNGFDEKIFFYKDKSISKQNLNIKTKFLVGFVGNLIPIKNASFLLEIFQKVYQEINDIQFAIIGNGELFSEIEQNCSESQCPVIMTGKLKPNNVAEYMQAMDILILPSKNEGFGCVIIEAHACGTYVIGSHVGGIPEAIGSYGSLIELDDLLVDHMAVEIIKILNHGFKHSCLIEQSKSFTWENVVSYESQIYNSILSK